MVKRSVEEWVRFFESTLLLIGTALFLSGIFFLVAFNWNHLDRFTKLGLVGSLNLIAYLFTILFRKKSLYFEIGLTLIFFLTGSALLVFGQIYQTGADVYDLFFGWSALTLLLIPVSRSGVVTGLWMILCAVTVYLYSEQVEGNGSHVLYSITSLLFGVTMICFDWFQTDRFSPKTKSFLSGLGLTIALSFLHSAVLSLMWVSEENGSSLNNEFYQILVPLIFYGFYYYYYRWVRFRLLNLTLILLFGLGQIFLKIMELFQIWSYSSGVSFLLFALLITGYTVWAVSHLQSLRKSQPTEEGKT
ncbi:membrane protein, PF09925 family [Leptospira wolbachii serovar Codice str. CDC]|uniref:Membrane protein, PF09925 family n=1 Tax=Leptospira wolbachii serovar Codice str. CDC TaxID=1218599 RepID=R9A7N5_9LEPT|nr:DUF2157 domain-containing protein [Leptospira wolbachii]EOQ98196.1 membrane protein, PF09925 family [Leptospira wolbachii serovar Codice str. CDC]